MNEGGKASKSQGKVIKRREKKYTDEEVKQMSRKMSELEIKGDKNRQGK